MSVEQCNLSMSQLKAVVAVARLGSFVAAASKLNTSQSSISRTIQGVEDSVGVPLFLRSTRRVEPTAAGREFIEVAERVLDELEVGLRNMSDLASLRRGQMVISTLQSVALGSLAEVLCRYTAEFSGIEIQLREGVQEQVEADVRSGVADFGIGATEQLDEVFHFEPLGCEHFSVLVQASHPWSHRESLTVADLANEKLISLPKGARTRALLELTSSRHNLRLNTALVASNFLTIVTLVARGAGVAVVPNGVVEALGGAQVRAIPLTDAQMKRDIGAIHLTGRLRTPAVAELVKSLRKDMAQSRSDRRTK